MHRYPICYLRGVLCQIGEADTVVTQVELGVHVPHENISHNPKRWNIPESEGARRLVSFGALTSADILANNATYAPRRPGGLTAEV
jgi:hypothetical protein